MPMISGRSDYNFSPLHLAEEMKENRILTTDFRDFSVYRWDNNQAFKVLLEQ